jgi:hypothetical protein
MDHENDRGGGPPTGRIYLTKRELAASTGLSETTLQRYKDGGRIPFFQPAGKGGRLLFPPDAVEAAAARARQEQQATTNEAGHTDQPGPNGGVPGRRKLPGPQPRWRTHRPDNRR